MNDLILMFGALIGFLLVPLTINKMIPFLDKYLKLLPKEHKYSYKRGKEE